MSKITFIQSPHCTLKKISLPFLWWLLTFLGWREPFLRALSLLWKSEIKVIWWYLWETEERLHSYFDKESNYPKADNDEDKRENRDPADKRYRELIQAKQTCLLLHLKKIEKIENWRHRTRVLKIDQNQSQTSIWKQNNRRSQRTPHFL